jgi:dephospho-CoA kinase
VIKAGITGNIGSGKSTVCRVFEILGVPVFHADSVAKSFYSIKENLELVWQHLGPEVVKDGNPDFKAIADIVFSDREKLKWLNSKIHPFVRQKHTDWIENYSNSPYTLYEAAILHESGQYTNMDKVITVSSPKDLRLKRIMERDSLSRESILARMANQWEEEKKVELSDFVIVNDENSMIIPQVLEVHKKLIQ